MNIQLAADHYPWPFDRAFVPSRTELPLAWSPDGGRRGDLRRDGELDDVARARKERDLLIALDVAQRGEQIGGVDDVRVRRGIADLRVRPVEDRPLGRARPTAEPGDPDARRAQLADPLRDDAPVVAARLADVGGPVLRRPPARDRRRRDDRRAPQPRRAVDLGEPPVDPDRVFARDHSPPSSSLASVRSGAPARSSSRS